jgi:polyhydroxybutyrate depolymerase
MRWRALALLCLVGCGPDSHGECGGDLIAPASTHECVVPGWFDRSFELDVPASWDGQAKLPLVIMFHGGGGSRQSANKSTCPGGDEDSPDCLVKAAAARGYAVVIPDGTGQRPLRNVRTWNGGGGNDLQCTSGPACKSRVDDLRYFGDLLAQVGATIPLDDKRVYLTGISNGGAISHRLACEASDRVAAIVGVSGANEFADDGGPCDVQVPVRQIHGTGDPCWAFDGGTSACLQDDGRPKTSVKVTMEGWRLRNGCNLKPGLSGLLDRDPDDGTTLAISQWAGCAAATELYTVFDGGHTWPSGQAYADADVVGRVSREVDNATVLDFFDAHVHP